MLLTPKAGPVTGNPQSHNPNCTSGSISCPNDKVSGDETTKRRKVMSQQEPDTLASIDESLSMPPCLVNLDPGVRITSVAAGGRHTLALSGKLLCGYIL